MFFNLFEEPYKKYTIGFILFCIFLIVALIVFWKIKYNLKKDHTFLMNNALDRCTTTPVTETIFVAITNLNDPDTINTIMNLYLHAYCPRRIFIGLCDQFKSSRTSISTVTLLQEYLKKSQNEKYYFPIPFESLESFLSTNIKTYTLSSKHESKGPDYSRAIIMKYLYASQKYILFVHSHSRFMPHWDLQMINQIHLTNDPSKSILTMIPNNIINASFLLNYDELIKLPKKSYQTRSGILSKQNLIQNVGSYFSEPPNYICALYQNDRGLPSYFSEKCITMPKKPIPQLFWSSLFSFSYAEPFIKNFQFDYNLENVFEGNEIAISARLWTLGYSFYTPINMIVLHHHYNYLLPNDRYYHKYNCDSERQFYHSSSASNQMNFAQQRIEVLLGIRSSKDIYDPEIIKDLMEQFGLGTTRSFQLYQQFIGLNFAEQNIEKDYGIILGLSKNYDIEEYVAKKGFH